MDPRGWRGAEEESSFARAGVEVWRKRTVLDSFTMFSLARLFFPMLMPPCILNVFQQSILKSQLILLFHYSSLFVFILDNRPSQQVSMSECLRGGRFCTLDY